ncbi:hypothetical protein MVLG_06917 [Microbotryum lychnidis-dioicae p1A1 Lamole]|uniref:Uncharacterized protein n=1 Tax=Microbotryum lychnidis-dioicae (strain p1A1 Lamole / MvSl-1064) TaxID=683840 RepID=U5HIR9_USTV1|nr:hypothetical protein MVLG_06917 [Microbotryum lychnidis-dioicae p1A1 Lamole]|eukprot:KDE02535.1 hypothetical protein MVLG_06917 [Microbotryum lychnidis-dioicae p1A1 Lamole]
MRLPRLRLISPNLVPKTFKVERFHPMTLPSYNPTCSSGTIRFRGTLRLTSSHCCAPTPSTTPTSATCPSTKWSERYDISPASGTVEVGKCPKGCVSYGAKRLEDLEECPTPGAARNVSRWGRMARRLNVIGPALANAKPSDKVVDLHKASGGSGSYPVVRRWVDGLHARPLYANGNLKPDDIPLATFSDGTEVLAHSNANRKVNTHISGVIPMTLPPGPPNVENDEGVIVSVLDHPEWAGLVDTATTFQTPGGRGVRLDNERNYKHYRRVVEAMKRQPTKLESLQRRTGISGEAPIEAVDLFKDAYSTFLPLDYMHLIGINSGSTFINILVGNLDSKACRHSMTLSSDAIARMTRAQLLSRPYLARVEGGTVHLA